METLFRFSLIRPAVAQDPANPSIDTMQDSPFQRDLEEVSEDERPREAMRQVALNFIAGPEFIGDPKINPLSSNLMALASSLDKLQEEQEELSHAHVVQAIRQAFGSEPEMLIENMVLEGPMTRLRDSIIAIKYLQEEHGRPIEALVNQLRDLELIVKVADDDTFPASVSESRKYRHRSLILNSKAVLQSVISTKDLEEERQKKLTEAHAELQKKAKALFDRHLLLKKAVNELTAIGSEHFQTSSQRKDEVFNPPDELTLNGIVTRLSAYHQKLSELNLQQLRAALDRGDGSVDPLRLQDMAGASSAAVLSGNVLRGVPSPQSGKPPFTPVNASEIAFRLKPTALGKISESTKTILSDKGLIVTEAPLDGMVASLESEKDSTCRELDLLYAQPTRRTFKRVGDTLVTILTPPTSAWADYIGASTDQPIPDLPVEDQIPTTRGKVAPAGVTDLLIVKQQLIGYEAADVAHIENALKGEHRRREHTRRLQTEQLTFLETEVTTSEERDLQTSNRFEMSQETSNTIKEDASLKAGLTVSGKYGPTVEFTASAEGALSRSKEEAIKTSNTFAQDVTERSANKITERVLQQESLRVTTEVTENNLHELNNDVSGAGNISGVYQWVNKVYQAQMFNYGLRTIYDFMIPEPASFLIEVMKSAQTSALEIQKPPEFHLEPRQINECNYGYYVRLYGATDITPPPEMYKTKSYNYHYGEVKEFTEVPKEDNQTVILRNPEHTHSALIDIDDGYLAIEGCVNATWANLFNLCSIDMTLGRRPHRMLNDSDWVWITDLDKERGSIPFALTTWNITSFALGVEVKCLRTEHAMKKWQLSTHAKLATAYKARLSEYEEKLAALSIQAGVSIQGKNPLWNIQIMNDELKKNCISILTDQHYVLFNAIEDGSNGLPQINISEADAEGSYVRFFEHAFEWENMTWVAYPYFWGRKSKWGDRITFEDPDPLFNQFLKAGYCRVVVPVRPGFESAIDHFMNINELWNGGPLPIISSPLYLPIADEMGERLDRPGIEVPEGNPWTVRIPTTLVKLRPDDSLPKWHKNEQGEWVPDGT